MALVARANATQLLAAAHAFDAAPGEREKHQRGLLLLAEGSAAAAGAISAMLKDAEPVLRCYGTLAAKRSGWSRSELFSYTQAREDSDLAEFVISGSGWKQT
jgi:hypothetical protein